MGLISHRVERKELKAGDHIYTWRNVYTYTHHGIYIGENKVVHFTATASNGSFSILNTSSSSSSYPKSPADFERCTLPDYCGVSQVGESGGVVLSCLDCFLGNEGSLHRFEYGVNTMVYLAKINGTCTTAKCYSPETVISTALFFIQPGNERGFGKYNVLNNNCEDFALFCKTGYLSNDKQSGQASVITTASSSAIVSLALGAVFRSSPVGIATGVGLYFLKKYANDVKNKN